MNKLYKLMVASGSQARIHLSVLAFAIAAAAGLCSLIPGHAKAQDQYFRLQLKSSSQYLDAEYCSANLTLNDGSDYAGGACQLWRLVPAGDGWSRLQLKSSSQYLDAEYCSANLTLNDGSDYADGACQLWRLVPAGDGWSRLQLKANGQYLDAKYCSSTISLNPGSDYAGGACQLWRVVPELVYGCGHCNDGSCQCGYGTNDELCAAHGGNDPEIGCTQQQ